MIISMPDAIPAHQIPMAAPRFPASLAVMELGTYDQVLNNGNYVKII